MGRPPGPVYEVDSTATNPVPATNAASLPEDRADLAALRMSIQASDLTIRSSKTTGLPRLNAFASYQLNDSRILGFGFGAYWAGIRLSWDLFKGNSIRNKTATLTIEKSKLTEQYAQLKDQSIAELNATRRRLGDAEYSISQQQAAVNAAIESYRILRDRYEQGLSGSTDVLLAQTQLSQQRLILAQALFNRDLTKAWLDFLTTSTEK